MSSWDAPCSPSRCGKGGRSRNAHRSAPWKPAVHEWKDGWKRLVIPRHVSKHLQLLGGVTRQPHPAPLPPADERWGMSANACSHASTPTLRCISLQVRITCMQLNAWHNPKRWQRRLLARAFTLWAGPRPAESHARPPQMGLWLLLPPPRCQPEGAGHGEQGAAGCLTATTPCCAHATLSANECL
jgi:hypothetical protein